MDLKNFKVKYAVLQKKYKLPSFEELNENFEIYKGRGKDEDCLLRGIRKSMIEKIVNALGFFDMLLSGMNAPRIYMNYIKTMTAEDRKTIEKIYTLFGEVSMASMALEIEYSEKDEAKLIADLNRVWNSVKKDFKGVVGNIRSTPESNNNIRKEKSYYG